jgi:hypothetical protein
MTEWRGIKVGDVYKRRGKGSRGAPLVMVIKLEYTPSGGPRRREPLAGFDDEEVNENIITLTLLEGGKVFVESAEWMHSVVHYTDYRYAHGENGAYTWPFVKVA